jgi:hypothetical protein
MLGLKLSMLQNLVDGDEVVVQYVGTNKSLQERDFDTMCTCGVGSWLEFSMGLNNIPPELADKVVINISMEEGCTHSSNTMFNLHEQIYNKYGHDKMFNKKSCKVVLDGEHYQHITQGDSLQNNRIVVTVTDSGKFTPSGQPICGTDPEEDSCPSCGHTKQTRIKNGCLEE